MEHCLVRVDINKPMALDYLDKAKRLTDEAIVAFNESMSFLNMTAEEFAEWWERRHANPFNGRAKAGDSV